MTKDKRTSEALYFDKIQKYYYENPDHLDGCCPFDGCSEASDPCLTWTACSECPHWKEFYTEMKGEATHE
jgi:hypothetical protein